MIVDDENVVEIASDSLGGCHVGIDIHILPQTEIRGHHRHLDITGDAQLTLDALLLSRHCLQLIISRLELAHLNQATTDIEHQDNRQDDKSPDDDGKYHPLVGETQGICLVLCTRGLHFQRTDLCQFARLVIVLLAHPGVVHLKAVECLLLAT